MTFKQIISNISDLEQCWKAKLDALGSNASYIRVHNPVKVSGSVDIDACLQKMRPNDPRWDYVFAVANKRNERMVYIEVHEKLYDQIDRVKNKYVWLIEWLGKNGGELNHFLDESEFYWLGHGQLSSHVPEVKALAAMGLEVMPSLDIRH